VAPEKQPTKPLPVELNVPGTMAETIRMLSEMFPEVMQLDNG